MPTTTIQQDRPPLHFSFISPGSFAVVSGQIDCDVNSTTTIQLPRKLIKRYREHSFSIIAEPNSSQNTSRCSSPPASGRVSPFRGRGFKGSGSTESIPLQLNGRATKSRIPRLVHYSRSNSLIKSSSANNIIESTTTTDSDGNIYNGYSHYNRSNKLLPKKSILSPIQGTPPSKKSSTNSSKSSPGSQIPKLTNRRSQSSNKRLAPKNDFIEQYFEETNKVPKAIVVNKFQRKQDTINNYKKHDVKVAPKGRKTTVQRNNQGNKHDNVDVTNGITQSTAGGQVESDLNNRHDVTTETKVNDNDKTNDKTNDNQNNADSIQEKDDNIQKDNSEDNKQMISNGISVTTSAIVHAVTNTAANPLEIETPISMTDTVDHVNDDTIDKSTSLSSQPNETIVDNLINKDKKTYPATIENVEIKVINSNITAAVDDKLVQNQAGPNDNIVPKLGDNTSPIKAQSSANASTPIVSNNVTVIKIDDAIVPHVIDHQSPDSLNISTISADNIGKSQPLPGDKVAATNIEDAQRDDKHLSKFSRIWQRVNKIFRRKSKKKIRNEPLKKSKKKKFFSFTNWKKNRQKNVADERDTNLVKKDVKKGFWPKLFSRKNKVADVNKEVTQKPTVVSNQKHRIPKIKRKRPFGERCRDFFRILFCLNLCRRNKSIKTSSESTIRSRSRSSTLSTKKTPSTTISKEDKHSVIDISLVEHNSDMRGAIPLLPMYLAWFCLICNILLPGFGKQKKVNLVDNDEQKEDRSLPFTSSSFTDVERGL